MTQPPPVKSPMHKGVTPTSALSGRLLAILPLLPPLFLLIPLLENPFPQWQRWRSNVEETDQSSTTVAILLSSSVGAQLVAYLVVALVGYYTTDRLVPHIQLYTLRKGICGKDMGKRGTLLEDRDIPEALGIVPGGVFLVCLIFCLVGYAASPTKLLEVNAALLSICFMLFLGFTDDVLDWPWRYKLILPTIASLPLICAYNGSTTIVVPIQLRPLLWSGNGATTLGHLLGYFVVIDSNSNGSLLELGLFYLVYMSMLAVFCTNAINIYAGINGLEAGQSYIIACAVLVHNLLEIHSKNLVENHLFSVMLMLSFIAVTLGLLSHNWWPAQVFVGDTYCYFAGMTFAVVAILGHFSKTLLLFFIPQVINFLWSTPQLFHAVPCPRHRLPRFDVSSGAMHPSTFPCTPGQFYWLKKLDGLKEDACAIPNMTVINLCLQICGPLSEKTLCITLLCFQAVCCGLGLVCRYYVAGFFFDDD